MNYIGKRTKIKIQKKMEDEIYKEILFDFIMAESVR